MNSSSLALFAALLAVACSADGGSDAGIDDPPIQEPPPHADSAPDSVGTADPSTDLGAQEAEAPANPAVPPAGAPVDSSGAAPAAVREAPAADPAAIPDTTTRPTFAFPRPDKIRGLYVNAWSAGSRRRLAALSELAGRTEINAFVVDIKDATGYVSHPTEVPLAREVGATGELRIPNLAVLLGRMEDAGLYPIARIVIVKDPLVAAARPDLAVQDTAGGPWIDNKDFVWLNPYNREVWDYHVALAREVAEMGFPEIQWDYVRFPDAPASAMRRARFPGSEGRSRRDAIRDFLAYSREALSDLDVHVTADVFGITTTAEGDVGIGQVWESFIDVVDVALPMVYPSHYWKGSYGYDAPNSRPYEVVRAALEDALRRSEQVPMAGATRPWLQDFTLGPPRYEAPEVRAQIQAAHDVGIDEWILWNPSSRYTEEALEPAAGFAADPLIRIADQIVPAARRFEFYDTATVAAPVTDPAPDTVSSGAGSKPPISRD